MARNPTQYRPQVSADFAFPRIGVVRPRSSPTPQILSSLGQTISSAAAQQAAQDQDDAVRKARYDASQIPLTAQSILLTGNEKFKDLKLQGTLSMPEQKAFDRATTAYFDIMRQRVRAINQNAFNSAVDGIARASDGDVEAYTKGVDEYRKLIGGVDLSTPDGAYFAAAVTRGQNNVAIAKADDERRAAERQARDNVQHAFDFGDKAEQDAAIAQADALNVDTRVIQRTGAINNALNQIRLDLERGITAQADEEGQVQFTEVGDQARERSSLLAMQKAIRKQWPQISKVYGLPKSAQPAAERLIISYLERANEVDRHEATRKSIELDRKTLGSTVATRQKFDRIKLIKNPLKDIGTLGRMITDLGEQRTKSAEEAQAALEDENIGNRQKGVISRRAIAEQNRLTLNINEAHRLLKLEQGELSDVLKDFAHREIAIRASGYASNAVRDEVNRGLIELKEISEAQQALPKELRMDPEDIARVSRTWSSLRNKIISTRQDANYARERFSSSNTQYSNSGKDQKAAETYLNAYRAIEREVLIDHLNPGFGDPAVVGYTLNTPVTAAARTSGAQLAQEFMMGARDELAPVDREYDPEINAAITMQSKAVPAPMAALIDSLEGNAIPVDAAGRANFENVVQFMASMKAQGIEADTFKKLGMSAQMIDRADQYVRHMRSTQFSDKQLSRSERSAAAISLMTERESAAFGKGLDPDLKEIFNAKTPTNTVQKVARNNARDIIREVAGDGDVPAELIGIVAQKLIDTAGRTGDLERAVAYTKIDLTGVIRESELARSMTASPTSDPRTVTLYPPEALARKYRNHTQTDNFGQNLEAYVNAGIRSYVEQYYPEYADKLGDSVFLQFDLGRNQYFLFEGASGLGSGDITVGAYRPQYLSSEDGGLIDIPVERITREANARMEMRLKEEQAGTFKDLKARRDQLQGDNQELIDVYIANAEAFHQRGLIEQRNKALAEARATAKRAGLPLPNPAFPVDDNE